MLSIHVIEGDGAGGGGHSMSDERGRRAGARRENGRVPNREVRDPRVDPRDRRVSGGTHGFITGTEQLLDPLVAKVSCKSRSLCKLFELVCSDDDVCLSLVRHGRLSDTKFW